MSATAVSILGHLGWTILLAFLLVGSRLFASMTKGNALNGFAQDGSDLPPLGGRITRAHGNSLEWMVIPVGLMLYGMVTGQTELTNGLAMICLYCRLGQSIVHMVSTSVPAVLVRATLFTVQVVIWAMWTWNFYNAA
ncbi:MAG: MAPEG family protein [Gammaproteobacteria bacterium]